MSETETELERIYARRIDVLEDQHEVLFQECERLRARVAELEAKDDSDKRYAANCPNCGAPMRVVRPGDARCSAECYIKDVPDANT